MLESNAGVASSSGQEEEKEEKKVSPGLKSYLSLVPGNSEGPKTSVTQELIGRERRGMILWR
jgi:hypothetical protein